MASSALPSELVADESLRRLLGGFPGAIWVTDRDLRIREVFGEDIDVLGLSADISRGKTISEVVGEAGEVAVAAHRRALAGSSGEYELAFRERVRRSRVEPLNDRTGSVWGVVGMSVDITDLETAEH